MSIRESCHRTETAAGTGHDRGEPGPLSAMRQRLGQIQQSWNADRIGEVEQFAQWLGDFASNCGYTGVLTPARDLAVLARDCQVHRITDSLLAISNLLDSSLTEDRADDLLLGCNGDIGQYLRDGLGASAMNLVAQIEQELPQHKFAGAESEQHILQCLARAAELRSAQPGNHVMRVGRYAAIVARALGISQQHAHVLECAAQLHDVGKIGVPDAILRKPTALDANEYEIMKQHCNFGTRILGPSADGNHVSPTVRLAARIAETHHEKWDGSGYPHGLAGRNIPLAGRITAIADVFDALNSPRPYHDPLPREDCFRIIREGRGRHFDPAIVDAFFAIKGDILRVQDELCDPA